jgi:hypothetical protein
MHVLDLNDQIINKWATCVLFSLTFLINSFKGEDDVLVVGDFNLTPSDEG